MQDDEAATKYKAIIAGIRQQTIAGLYNCLYRMAAQLAHAHESCPRQSCRRAHRCRGRTCRHDVERA
jgi:hypothetical protein